MAARTHGLRQGLGLRASSTVFLLAWVVVAAFPLVWTAAMSLRSPLDAFSADPLRVLLGPATLAAGGGLSVLDLAAAAATLAAAWLLPARFGRRAAMALAPAGRAWVGWVLAGTLYAAAAAAVFLLVLPPVLRGLGAVLAPVPGLGLLAHPVIGFTGEHYRTVWFGFTFYRQFLNSMAVTAGVVLVSLTVGTLAGYALARTRTSLAFGLLIAALVFRALPHSVLVAGYLPPFIQSHELLTPLWEAPGAGWLLRAITPEAPTLYGQRLPVILVLVAINQPFTIWMLRSFFASIPAELDEAARVDGCTHFEAFRRVIMPVMWPGVITTGLFSFLLAYNDFLVTSLLLDQQAQTMVPAIAGFLARENSQADELQAIAAAVSITAPLFLLVMAFQRQIVSGLTAGAVKG